ncbi:glycosyltransferase family 1 protein [Schizophyllum amplum]|uniref:Glycosyltransferase family 1 protein n=1 Tax=Schizophyllum amplum TaxID=97359 RepID=A0A550CYT6_9AGAR|nr:glycosyltransferase family 1 protein [Auriculariopsis ampla]
MVDILFLTWGEYGQSSVHLATAFELYSRRFPGVDIHIASSVHLEARFDQVKARIDRSSGRTDSQGNILFHVALAKSYEEVASDGGGFIWNTMEHPPMHRQTHGFPDIAHAMCPYPPDEYVRGINSCAELIQKLSPDAVLVDMLFSQAIDACKLLHQRYIILSPLPGCDMTSGNQSYYSSLFYYPSVGLDVPFPISTWKDMFANALNLLRLTYILLTDGHIRALDAARRARGCTWPHPVLTSTTVSPDTPCLAAGIPEVDLPFTAPEGLRQFGPICLPSESLADGDPELKAWLDRKETIIMVMGSHKEYDDVSAREVLHGLLAGSGGRQILWKVPTVDKLRGLFNKILTTEHDRDRVRIVRWFDVEPSAIVEHENVICYIHHGGANSYLECARSGTPQVILPVWFDTYRNAIRVEYRGLGVYGSRGSAPSIRSEELGEAVWRVVSGPDSAEYRRRARHVGEICREAGGRERVADAILDYLSLRK